MEQYLHHLRSGRAQSCGCLQQEKRTKHGMCGTRVYTAWESMIQRCKSKHPKIAPHYRDRGIRVCERWQDFPTFYADMGDHPGDGWELDRIDNDRGYEPGNCRWANRSTQLRNRRYKSVSGVRGVCFHKQRGKWQAYIDVNGRRKSLGLFASKDEAAAARRAAGLS